MIDTSEQIDNSFFFILEQCLSYLHPQFNFPEKKVAMRVIREVLNTWNIFMKCISLNFLVTLTEIRKETDMKSFLQKLDPKLYL